MNLGTLRTEFLARGFDFLSSTRANQFINDGYHGVCEWESTQWPFLETTTTGTAPLTISDLREILYVVDTTTNDRLEQADSRDIIDMDPALSTAGTPRRYWLDGLTTLRLWQTNTSDSLSVRYIKVPTDLSSDSDTPVLPTRYHRLIVDMAEVVAYEDASDFQNAQAKRQLLEEKLQRMSAVLVLRNDDDPDYIQVTNNDAQGWNYWC